jgi:hypothetical protein
LGISAIALTIFPVRHPKKEAARREPIRLAFNEIIRETFGGAFECDPILSEGNGYKDGFCCPDGAHLTELGGKALADALDLEMLTGLRLKKQDAYA